MRECFDRVRDWMMRHAMAPAGVRLGVAVSGGADSVFLWHALRAVSGARLTILHVDHGLRGAESEADALFVRELADGAPVLVTRAAPPGVGNLEQHCRRERHRIFAEWRAAGCGDRVATGHTRSDQAETVLLRLLRGTGPTGLRGVLPVTREGLVRPLLDLERAEIRAALAAGGWRWREDSSNASPRFLRNRVRAEVLPLLRQLAPRVEESLGRLAEIAAEEEDYWESILENPGQILDVAALRAMPRALRRRVLRRVLADGRGDLRRLTRQHIDAVEDLTIGIRGEGSVVVPGLRVVRSMGQVRFGDDSPTICRYTETVVLDLDQDRLRGPLRFRGWQPGDRFHPEGREEAVLVKKLLTGARIPSWERSQWPILTDGESVVWVYRFGADRRFAASGDTRNVLHVEKHISEDDESLRPSSTSFNLRKQ